MIKYGDRGEKVKELQRQLKNYGFNPGPIDGVFGSLTLSAWSKFEHLHLLDYKSVTDEELDVLIQLNSYNEIGWLELYDLRLHRDVESVSPIGAYIRGAFEVGKEKKFKPASGILGVPIEKPHGANLVPGWIDLSTVTIHRAMEAVEPIQPFVHGMVDDNGFFYPDMPSNKWNVIGKGVLINNGHSRRNNGAFSDNGVVAEYDLNLRQANHICKKLDEIGIPNKMINQMDVGNDLWATGQNAEGYDMFCSLHHNSTDGAQYSCYMLGKNPKEGSKQFGPSVSKKIAEALNLRDSGLISSPLAVASSAERTDCPVVVLIESYFIDPMENYEQANSWSDKAADAIVDAIIDWFKV